MKEKRELTSILVLFHHVHENCGLWKFLPTDWEFYQEYQEAGGLWVLFESRGKKLPLPLVCPEAGFSDDVNRIHRSGNPFLQGDFFNPRTVGILSWIILSRSGVAGGCPVLQMTLSSISATPPHLLDASNKLPSQLWQLEMSPDVCVCVGSRWSGTKLLVVKNHYFILFYF